MYRVGCKFASVNSYQFVYACSVHEAFEVDVVPARPNLRNATYVALMPFPVFNTVQAE